MLGRMSRLLSVGLFVAGLSVVPALAAERRVALVIGNAEYRHAKPLANPEADASDIAAILKSFGFEVIEGRNLDKAGMDRTIRDFATALIGAGASLFYYAGHGLQVGGQNYLVPVDAKLDAAAGLDFEAIRLDLVQRTMERETKVNVLFLDACRDSPFVRNLARAFGTRSAQVAHGLAAMESGEGTLISFSTQPGNVALDGQGRNSPYADALKKHMPVVGDDLSTILINVRNDVLRATESRQRTWEHQSLQSRFFFVAPPPSDPRPPLAPSFDRQEELLFWTTVKDSKDRAMLQSYLDRYPAGTFAAPAKLMLQQGAKEEHLPPKAPVQTAAVAKEGAKEDAKLPSRQPDAEFVRKLQSELRRVGCYTGRIDGKWGDEGRAALTDFARHSKVSPVGEEPSVVALDAVSSQKDRVCPLECGAGEVEVDGRCVTRETRKRPKLKSKAAAVAPPEPPPKRKAVERKRVERKPAAHKGAERKPAVHKRAERKTVRHRPAERKQATGYAPRRPQDLGSKKMCWSQGKMVLVRCDDPTAMR
ncbi:MAG: caspase family protein [Hyphomicrobiaceae bacterium]